MPHFLFFFCDKKILKKLPSNKYTLPSPLMRRSVVVFSDVIERVLQYRPDHPHYGPQGKRKQRIGGKAVGLLADTGEVGADWTDEDCAKLLKALVTKTRTDRRETQHKGRLLQSGERIEAKLTQMLATTTQVGPHTLNTALSAAVSCGFAPLYFKAMAVFAERNIPYNRNTYTAILMRQRKLINADRSARDRCLQYIAKTMDHMPTGLVDSAHHTVVIGALVDAGYKARALRYFLLIADEREASEERHMVENTPDFSYAVDQAFRACSTEREVDMVWNAHAQFALRSSVTVFAAAEGYARLGLPKKVEQLADAAGFECCGMDLARCMMLAYRVNNEFVKVAETFKSIYESGEMPTVMCFDIFIRACMDCAMEAGDRFVVWATDAYKEADCAGLLTSSSLFSSLMELYAAVRDVEQGRWLLDVMQEKGMRQSKRVFVARSQLQI